MEPQSKVAVETSSSRDPQPRLSRAVQLGLAGGALLIAAFLGMLGALLYLDRPPRAMPYFAADLATWLVERTPHPGHVEMPVVPIGAAGRLAPRALAADLLAADPADDLALAAGDGALDRVRAATDDGGSVEFVGLEAAGSRLFGLSRAGDLFVLHGGDAGGRWARVDVTDISALQHEEEDGSSAGSNDRQPLSLAGDAPATALAWAPDGRALLIVEGSVLRVWREGDDVASVLVPALPSPLTAVSWSPDGTTILTGHADGTLHSWNAATGVAGASVAAHATAISAMSWDPAGGRFVTVAEDHALAAWHFAVDRDGGATITANGAELQSGGWDQPDVPALVSWWPGSDRILSNGPGGDIIVLTPPSGGEGWLFGGSVVDTPETGKVELAIDQMAMSPDGRTVAWSDPVSVKDLATGEVTVVGFPSAVGLGFVWSPNGRLLAIPYEVQGFVNVTIRRIDGTQLISIGLGVDRGLAAMAWSPDGGGLAMAITDGTTTIFSMEGLNLRLVRDVAAAPDGRRIMVAGDHGLLELYDPDAAMPGWRRQDLGVTADFVAVATPLDTVAWAAARDGRLFVKREGEDWTATAVQPPVTEPADIDFLDARSGWVAGRDGTIAITGDGGASWTTALPVGGAALTGIYIGPGTGGRYPGWAVGRDADGDGVVLRADDAADPASWSVLGHGLPPLAYALAALVVAFLFVAGRLYFNRRPRSVQAVRQTQTADAPLGETDPDVLGLRPIARGLSHVMRNRDTAPPLTIAVQGSWGTGKSSLMNLLCVDLRRYHCRPVWFNAWHHQSEEHLLAALLERIRGAAVPGWWRTSGFGFRWRLFRRRVARSSAGVVMVIPLLLVFLAAIELFVPGDLLLSGVRWLVSPSTEIDLGIGVLNLGPPEDADLETVLAGWMTGILGGALPLVLILWLRSKLAALTARPSALLSRVGSFALVPRFTESLSFREKFGRQFADVCWALRRGNNPGLVVVIDDLDRCKPEQVLAILEAINYLASVGACFIIVGMDRFQVEHCVGSAFKDLVDSMSDHDFRAAHGLPAGDPDQPDAGGEDEHVSKHRRYAQNYLKKLINVEIDVPRMTADHVSAMFAGGTAASLRPGGTIERAPIVRWTQRALAFAAEVAPVVAVVVIVAWIAADTVDWSPILRQPPPAPPVELQTAPAPDGPQADGGGVPGQDGTVTPSGDEEASTVDPLLDLPPGPVYGVAEPESFTETDYLLLAIQAVTVAVFIVALLLFLRFLRRRRQVQPHDPPDFAAALDAVRELVFATERNPRGVKRFQNRMRILSALQQPQSERPGLTDLFFDRLGRALRRPFVRLPPAALIDTDSSQPLPPPDGIGFAQLVMLGAVEPHLARLPVTDHAASEEERFQLWFSGKDAPWPPDLKALWAQVRRQYSEGRGAHPVFRLPTLEDIRNYVRISRRAKG